MSNSNRQRLFAAACRLHSESRRLAHGLSGVTAGEFMVLLHIQRMQGENGVRVSELSHHLRMSRPAISQILRSLEQKQLIVRETSKQDRRAVLVRMTEEGCARYRELTGRLTVRMDHVLEHFGSEKTEQLISLLNELTGILETDL